MKRKGRWNSFIFILFYNQLGLYFPFFLSLVRLPLSKANLPILAVCSALVSYIKYMAEDPDYFVQDPDLPSLCEKKQFQILTLKKIQIQPETQKNLLFIYQKKY